MNNPIVALLLLFTQLSALLYAAAGIDNILLYICVVVISFGMGGYITCKLIQSQISTAIETIERSPNNGEYIQVTLAGRKYSIKNDCDLTDLEGDVI